MNEFFKNVIEETFATKKQQRFFFAKSKDKSLSPKERKKWAKMASEFASKTNFEKLPEENEQDVDEIVDELGNIARSSLSGNASTKFIGSKETSDQVAARSHRAMGMYGVTGTVQAPQRYWAEADMSKSLGYDETLGDDESYKKAFHYFTKDLGLSREEAIERLKSMGYIPGEKELVRLVENPKKFMEDYIESVLSKKDISDDLVSKEEGTTKKEINPIIKKQLDSLKTSLGNNNLNVDDVITYLKNEQ